MFSSLPAVQLLRHSRSTSLQQALDVRRDHRHQQSGWDCRTGGRQLDQLKLFARAQRRCADLLRMPAWCWLQLSGTASSAARSTTLPPPHSEQRQCRHLTTDGSPRTQRFVGCWMATSVRQCRRPPSATPAGTIRNACWNCGNGPGFWPGRRAQAVVQQRTSASPLQQPDRTADRTDFQRLRRRGIGGEGRGRQRCRSRNSAKACSNPSASAGQTAEGVPARSGTERWPPLADADRLRCASAQRTCSATCTGATGGGRGQFTGAGSTVIVSPAPNSIPATNGAGDAARRQRHTGSNRAPQAGQRALRHAAATETHTSLAGRFRCTTGIRASRGCRRRC